MVTISKTKVIAWASGIGASGVGIAVLLSYLAAQGLIQIDGFSGDSFCLGTDASPCYGYVNFTAKENITFTLVDYNPQGNASLYFFEPSIKSWRMEYFDGKVWKEYTTKTVTWKANTKYQLRVKAYKRNPSDVIKWSAFSGAVDPLWYGPNGTNYTTVETCVPFNETHYYALNLTREITTNSTPPSWIENYSLPTGYFVEVQWCKETGISIAGVTHDYIQADKQCLRTNDTLCCWSYKDGGFYINRNAQFRTSIDSGESGICVNLAANMTILEKKGEVSVP